MKPERKLLTFLGSLPPPIIGGLTRGTPKHRGFIHSSASIAHPFKRRFAISAEAASDCSRQRIDSAVSTGGAKVGELKALEISVGGVDDLDLDKWVLVLCVILGDG